MYIPTSVEPLSHSQVSKLLKGHSVRVTHGHGHQLHLSHQQHKKLMSSHVKGKGMNLMLDPYQIDMHGQGFLSSAMSAGKKLASSKIGKTLAKQAINAGSKYASNYIPPSVASAIANEANSHVQGMGFFDNAIKGVVSAGKKVAGNKIVRSLGNAVAQAGTEAVLESRKTLAPAVIKALSGSGVKRRHKNGKKAHGGALFPAGSGLDIYEY
jgi:hypothetical protein